VKEIKEALKQLGVTGKVRIKKCNRFVLIVYVNGRLFGLWDIAKKTFIE